MIYDSKHTPSTVPDATFDPCKSTQDTSLSWSSSHYRRRVVSQMTCMCACMHSLLSWEALVASGYWKEDRGSPTPACDKSGNALLVMTIKNATECSCMGSQTRYIYNIIATNSTFIDYSSTSEAA